MQGCGGEALGNDFPPQEKQRFADAADRELASILAH